jgi:hypothetical protein
MARPRASHIPRDLRSLFPTRWLNTTARGVGLIERRRKVAPAAFFWTLVRAFAVGHRRSIASLRRFYWATSAAKPTKPLRLHGTGSSPNRTFLLGRRADASTWV